jgi:hypothetical protein
MGAAETSRGGFWIRLEAARFTPSECAMSVGRLRRPRGGPPRFAGDGAKRAGGGCSSAPQGSCSRRAGCLTLIARGSSPGR